MSRNSRRKIAIGTATRNRPKMLRALLDSYANMEFPEGNDVDFLIVENDKLDTASGTVDEFREAVRPHNVFYILERKIGISHARNSALEYSIHNGYDILAFADDDETVDPRWLVELLNERDRDALDIVGSPVRIAPVDTSFSWWNKLLWRAFVDINLKAERRCLKRVSQGRGDSLKIATGSWMGDLAFFRRTGLRFDNERGSAGGEDWHLYDRAKSLGARTGWTPNALAYETMPASRLSLGYYYRKYRNRARVLFLERYQESAGKAVLRLPGSLLSRLYKAVVAVLTFPVDPGGSLLACAREIGSFVGFVQGCFGVRSKHYEHIDGY
jgi:glycosyltransferase involved in cell wall biosynthesis